MTKITRITTQKNNKQRYNIFLDDGQGEKYGFSVDEAVLAREWLQKGMELDAATISMLVQQDTLHKSYNQAINYLSYRMRTKKEIVDYLVKKETDPEHITKIIDKLISERLINDEQFAEAFVNTRIHTSDKGPILIQRELIEKGVSHLIAEKSVEKYTYDVQYDKALKWAEKKLKQTKKNAFRKQLQQMQATLMQKGFTQDVIQEVAAEIQEEKDEEAEWEAIIHHGGKLQRKHQQKYVGYELRNKMKEGLYRKGFSFELINQYLDEQLQGDM